MTDQEIQDLMFSEVYMWIDLYVLGDKAVLIGYDKFSDHPYYGRVNSEPKPIWFKYIEALPKKRLMTPAELAGGVDCV